VVTLQATARLILVIGILGFTIPTISYAANPIPMIKKGVAAVILGAFGGAGKGFGEDVYARLKSSPASVCSTEYGDCRVPSGKTIPKDIACSCETTQGDLILGVTQ
jgi:hypothetical protein